MLLLSCSERLSWAEEQENRIAIRLGRQRILIAFYGEAEAFQHVVYSTCATCPCAMGAVHCSRICGLLGCEDNEQHEQDSDSREDADGKVRRCTCGCSVQCRYAVLFAIHGIARRACG